jgi:hypothetical protein
MIAGADDRGRPQSLAGVTLHGAPISFAQVGGSSLAGPMWKKAMGVISAQLPPIEFAPPPEPDPDADDPAEPADPANPLDPANPATPVAPAEPFDPLG